MRARILIPLITAGILLVGIVLVLRIPSTMPGVSPLSPTEQPEIQATPSSITPTTMNVQAIAQKVTVTLNTNKGALRLELDGTRAPLAVGNFVSLAQRGFYDGTTFHRVIPDFMIQAGDPLSKDASQRARHGTGGPGYTFPDETTREPLVRGSVAMANAGPNTNGSQFFIVTAEATPHLDGKHTNFGKVISGMEVVDAISRVESDARDNPVQPVVIESVTVDTALTAPSPAAQ